MPIFREHKTIFIHIPKTAGTTILRMFGYDSVPNNDMFYHIDEFFEYDHASALLIKSRERKIYDEFYKFTLVRNPYDRLVSEYAWKVKDNDRRSLNVEDKSFKDFVHEIYCNFDKIQSQIHKEKSHLIPQSHFVLDDVNVFKFENLEVLIEKLNLEYNLPILNVKHNQTSHKLFHEYYDQDTCEMVYDMYRSDFMLFDYDKCIMKNH
jgi:hypothetical protein